MPGYKTCNIILTVTVHNWLYSLRISRVELYRLRNYGVYTLLYIAAFTTNLHMSESLFYKSVAIKLPDMGNHNRRTYWHVLFTYLLNTDTFSVLARR